MSNCKLVFFLLMLSLTTNAQDTLILNNRVSLIPFFGMDRLSPNTNKEVRMPDAIRLRRLLGSQPVYTNYPQWHFSMFGGMATETELADGYHFRLNLIGEDRAGSYGVFKQNNTVVFPQISATISDTIRVGSIASQFDLLIGDMVDFRYRNGLAIYNVDVQGAVAALTFKQWKFEFTSITDLSQHIGLGVGEVYGTDLARQNMRVGQRYQLDIGIAADLISGGDIFNTTPGPIPHLYFNLRHKQKSLEFYGEAGHRFYTRRSFFGISAPPTTLTQRMAGLLGVSFDGKSQNQWRHQQRFELKYYGSIYNAQRTSVGSFYSSGTSFIGRYLYPLRNAYRPFDQWAVFTEYVGKNTAAFSWLSRNKCKLHKRFFWMLDLETIGILAQEETPFLYYFYETGLVFEPVTGLEALVYLSNKVMNLDVHYQTYYQSKQPLFSFGLRKRLTGYF